MFTQVYIGAFSYDFGALGDTPSEYLKAHTALLYVLFLSNSSCLFISDLILYSAETQKKPGGEKNFGWSLAGLELLEYIPYWVLRPICILIFRNPLIKNFRGAARKIASEIIEKEKGAAAGEVPEGKDIMSIMGEMLIVVVYLTGWIWN